MQRIYEAGLESETGHLGWKPEGVRYFTYRAPGHNFDVAHDTLEHPEVINATLSNEFRAHGAALYIRPHWFSPIPIWQAVGANMAWFIDMLHQGLALKPHSPSMCDLVLNTMRSIPRDMSAELHDTVSGWLQQGFEEARERFADWRIGASFTEIDARIKLITPTLRQGSRVVVNVERHDADIKVIN